MKPLARFAILSLIPLGCATEVNDPLGNMLGVANGGTSAGDTASGGSSAGSTTAGTPATTMGGAAAGTSSETGGTFPIAGTFGTAGTFVTGGAGASSGGMPAAGTSGSGGASAGSGGKATGGAGSSSGGNPGTAGMAGSPPVGDYCDSAAKSPLPYTVNDGFQPSGWQGDIAAISAAGIDPDACATRPAGAVGGCSKWRFTPNAVTPTWSGVSWSKVWDANYTHPPVCLAAGATKITFQARGAAGGEIVTFSGAGGPEVPFTLTNAWKKYEISLAGVVYNTPADGVDSGFFWKVAPPTPGGGAVTFFVDDIQIIK